ncbi:3-oxoacyl-(Acyl-carrier protein) reductase [Geobacillus thermoleovorans CCB_US3_UF5]|jgi:3-oxoacyl-[acyl-carrier protein] reductase|uniref:3-oxoacyl-(Acyl-carrier protein) reductase n=1 Tax=Geobacillus thermoleovorans CCB_US3_UF5 TaxID=1111068 RepID=A0ABM5MI01_GEOTH|nr:MULTISPECIES: 3-oxoacyl-ACP reductase FabG [Bacillaceae]AEV19295.1 3-oxoacyl-(Acyl-carrier protein) reductase [Geobacillus thermoleovorans CCB_US3_UF5]NNU95799.1 SDR family oxidoreductase [Anoxybacillus sp. EFIL]QDY73369.1 SDR family oxidoreductase [Geobacillus thermoleovorans]
MLLKDKIAVVTGATRGIGKAIVQTFVKQGAFVVGIYANNDAAAKELEAILNVNGQTIHYVKGSVNNPAFVQSVIGDVIDTYGRVDILVNNAGINRDQFIFKMSEEEWNQVISTNFSGTLYFCQSVLPFMEQQQKGKIVNVVSVTGVVGREAQTNYGTSKGAIIGLTRLLARKYYSKGISINAIAPGMIETEMIHHVPEDKISNFLRFTNAKRLGTAEEVARNVLYLSSDLSDYVTDTVLKVDGGFIR